MTERTGKDQYLYESKNVRVCLSPRIILLDEKRDLPLVRYKNTKWLGLPGGRVKVNETSVENFLSAGSFPTLEREVYEECGIDISGFIKDSFYFGLIVVAAIDDLTKKATIIRTPLFVCPVGNREILNDKTIVVNIMSHIPGPLFPDARAGITRWRTAIQQKNMLSAECLNPERIYYFTLSPEMKLLMLPPSWLYHVGHS